MNKMLMAMVAVVMLATPACVGEIKAMPNDIQNAWCFSHGGPQRATGLYISWYNRCDKLVDNQDRLITTNTVRNDKIGLLCKLINIQEIDSADADADCQMGKQHWQAQLDFSLDHEGSRLTMRSKHVPAQRGMSLEAISDCYAGTNTSPLCPKGSAGGKLPQSMLGTWCTDLDLSKNGHHAYCRPWRRACEDVGPTIRPDGYSDGWNECKFQKITQTATGWLATTHCEAMSEGNPAHKIGISWDNQELYRINKDGYLVVDKTVR
jgi:hypothetical protein